MELESARRRLRSSRLRGKTILNRPALNRANRGAGRTVTFRSLPHARLALDAWRDDYNMHRPHSKLGWLTPAGYAARWTQNEELEGRPLGAFDDDRTPAPAG